MSDTKLLPCPFCGHTDELVIDTLGDPDDWFVECDRCHLGTHAIFRGREATAAAWNTRAPDPAAKGLAGALEELRDATGETPFGSRLMYVVLKANTALAQYREAVK